MRLQLLSVNSQAAVSASGVSNPLYAPCIWVGFCASFQPLCRRALWVSVRKNACIAAKQIPATEQGFLNIVLSLF